ncbi:hypothetical protein ABZZ79_10055 [Streptomyces sp. NPDC006458]|uniref:hypothetical protein n=1 Tax=Streptomyces sp. NPDC006458 TaxID=3154302 RepID=UPI00339E1FAA
MSQTELPPRRPRTLAEHRDAAKIVLFYALALGAVLFGVAALIFGLAWADLVDKASPF